MSKKIETAKIILKDLVNLWNQGLCEYYNPSSDAIELLKDLFIEFGQDTAVFEPNKFDEVVIPIDPNSLLVGYLLDMIANDPEYIEIWTAVSRASREWAEKGRIC